MRLTEKRLIKLSNAISQMYIPKATGELPEHFIGIVRQVLDCEHLSYNEFSGDHFCGVVDPVINDKLNATFGTLAHQHPSIRHVRKTQTIEAVQISDFVTAREWKKCELYNEFFRELGITSQLAFLFRTGSVEIGFAANRAKSDFNEDERLLLNLLQPHFRQVYENAKAMERILRVSDFRGGGTVVFSGDGTVLFWSAKARNAISRFFGPVAEDKLPNDLLLWAKRGLAARSVEAHEANHPLSVEAEKSVLTVRLSPNLVSDEHVLMIEEQPKEFPISVFTKFGHSRREAEVLSWIAQGKTNPEIAIILDISPRTVAHHVERILSKIGVEGRGGAGAWAQETLRAQHLQQGAASSFYS